MVILWCGSLRDSTVPLPAPDGMVRKVFVSGAKVQKNFGIRKIYCKFVCVFSCLIGAFVEKRIKSVGNVLVHVKKKQ